MYIVNPLYIIEEKLTEKSMAVFTFSTKGSKPEDTKAVKRIKEHCEKHGINFSAVVLRLLKEWEADEQRRT